MLRLKVADCRTAEVAWQLMPFLLVGLVLVLSVALGLDALALALGTRPVSLLLGLSTPEARAIPITPGILERL